MEKQNFNPQLLNIALGILVSFVFIWVLIIGRDIILQRIFPMRKQYKNKGAVANGNRT